MHAWFCFIDARAWTGVGCLDPYDRCRSCFDPSAALHRAAPEEDPFFFHGLISNREVVIRRPTTCRMR